MARKYEALAVMAPGEWENELGPKDWFAISDEHLSIVAYACCEGVAQQIMEHLTGEVIPEDVFASGNAADCIAEDGSIAIEGEHIPY